MSNKYEVGTFGYWWTTIKGKEDIADKIYLGDINCSERELTSLIGCPKWVRGDFSCSNNLLKTLKHAPIKIEGDFYCNNNLLVSLEYCPEIIGKNFYCQFNNLASFDCSSKIGGDFIADNQVPAFVNVFDMPKQTANKGLL